MIVCIACGLFGLVMISCDVTVEFCMLLLVLLLTLFGLVLFVGLRLVLLDLLLNFEFGLN